MWEHCDIKMKIPKQKETFPSKGNLCCVKTTMANERQMDTSKVLNEAPPNASMVGLLDFSDFFDPPQPVD